MLKFSARQKLFFRILISVILLFILLSKVNFASVASHLRGANFWALAGAFALVCLNYFVSSYRWQGLAKVKGISAPLFGFVRLYFIGAFFNNFLPTSVGGDVVKAYKLSQMTDKKVDAAVSVFMERFTGVVVLGLISLGAFIYEFKLQAVLVSMGLLLLGAVGVWLAPRIVKFHHLFKKAYDSIVIYRGEKAVLWQATWTSFLVQIIAITTQYLVFVALGVKVSYLYCLFVIPPITVASMLPISINGVGIQDVLFVLFFGPVGVSRGAALAVSFVYHILRLGSSLVGGILYLLE